MGLPLPRSATSLLLVLDSGMPGAPPMGETGRAREEAEGVSSVPTMYFSSIVQALRLWIACVWVGRVG